MATDDLDQKVRAICIDARKASRKIGPRDREVKDAALEAIAANRTANYQPWWAARAHILRRLGRQPEARAAFERAASLTEDPAVRAHLLELAARPG